MNHQRFAEEWICAWNSHDLDHILSHYAEDIEISTPMIAMATGGKESTLKGKEAVREYWKNFRNFILSSYSLQRVLIQ